ncbi:MAG: hypothetical protein JJE50_13860 [Actinomycetales bacterium]|nr:hypothetical protein [Actinomycetales bacterium]
MSALDLSAAAGAGGKALADMARDWYCPKHPDRPRYMCEWCLAEVAVTAAAPLITVAVREQAAARIDTLRSEHVSSYGAAFDDGFTSACEIAAHIARDGRP